MVAWVAVLMGLSIFVQIGHTYDEAEHCHVAWMMGQLGQKPLVDFFQHHMPLLWEILKVYYQMGFQGPEIMIFGRLLVVLSLFGVGWGWWQIARKLAPTPLQARFGAAVAYGALMLLYFLQRDILVIRPETLALAPWVWACAAWVGAEGRQPRPAAILSCLCGILYSISLFLSPRLIFLLGWLFALWGRRRPQMLGWFALGGLGFAAGYAAFGSASPAYLYFAVVYSARLQKIGNWASPSYPSVEPVVIVILALVWVPLLALIPPENRSRAWLHLAYLTLIFAAGWGSSFPHLYLQNFVPCYLSLCTSFLMLGCQARWHLFSQARRLIWLGLTALGVACSLSIQLDCDRNSTLFSILEDRHRTLAELGPDDTVMMVYQIHPITARDASYYGPWLGDGQNRMGEAVSAVRERFSLPECDYFRDLQQNKPKFVDSDLDLAMPENLSPALRTYLAQHYEPELWTHFKMPRLLRRR